VVIILEIFGYLSELNIPSIILRLFLATFFGGIIGFERGLKKRPAGLRTFALVCIGSATVMITNEYLCENYEYGGDPSRMAAQVISGVGFLGAGTIIVTGRQQVKGLTTAASLWATASIGLAIGAGFYWGAILSFSAIFFAITVLHTLDEKLNQNSKTIELYIEAEGIECIESIVKYSKENGYTISSFEKKEDKIVNSNIIILLEFNLKRRVNHNVIVNELGMIDKINFVEEIR